MSTTPTDSPDLRFDWSDYQDIADQPEVYETIRALLDDHTEDNATCMVRAVIEAAAERLLKLTQAQQAQGEPCSQPISRERAIAIARKAAVAARDASGAPAHSYLPMDSGENWHPHEWVVEAIMAAPQAERAHGITKDGA